MEKLNYVDLIEQELLESDAARWRKIREIMIHSSCGPNFGWTLDILIPGNDPDSAVDTLIRGQSVNNEKL